MNRNPTRKLTQKDCHAIFGGLAAKKMPRTVSVKGFQEEPSIKVTYLLGKKAKL
ncbi:hypothetical protein L1077_20075 [Pseudoalteromonas luteoviolacea]|uniref:hypothetical protein n=1 Tax=Pseudoalteromonas luteoviolacea TaxID=43657 RepID=UPI001F223344|nr:hypothetical protein [Pseudoalteromonas luteoviolacea]MCF6441738.1 hypothetical protein [Pseudoalteromonas luteoviolacea]